MQASGSHRRAAAAQRQQQGQRYDYRGQVSSGGYANGGGYVGFRPPAPSQSSEVGLKDLLAQVAPNARISENNSQLATRASARLLGKVLGASSSASAAAGSIPPAAATGAGTCSTFGGGRGSSDDPWSNGPGWTNGAGGPPQPIGKDEDEEEEFMSKWAGLFGKRSPLADGTATDPFSDELHQRNKVVWKKGRAGHHRRYQQRRQQRESQANGEDDDEDEDGDGDGDGGHAWSPPSRRGGGGPAP